MIKMTALVILLTFSGASCAGQSDYESGEWLLTSEGCKVASSMAPNAASINWTGECRDGLAHGRGELSWVNADGSKGRTHTCLNNTYGGPSCVFGSSQSRSSSH
ncbi:hypothetical protein L4D76_25900 [Photobacterium sagamiensis]|uniref:hypothetical protein n=1 Tax=Photobacterium sagamiensis TaxID=2910241 RepID=UPI003D0D02EC